MSAPFADARRLPSLVGEVYESATLDDATLRAMWDFRQTLVRLRDGVDPAGAFEGFCASIREGRFTSVLREGGAIVSMGTWVLRERRLDGEPFGFLLVKGLYVTPRQRGSVRNALLTLEGMARLLGRHGAVWAGGPVLLPGWLALNRLGAKVWLVGEMPPAVEAVYRALAPEFATLDAATGTVRENFHTTEPAPRRPTDPRRAALYDRFTARHPGWASGDHGFALTRIDASVFPRLLREGLGRRRR
ncbi:MAG: hypothetical protein JWM10_4210 [Myxococcaceae bacterium]|nr:hypothetical protein [Myxococcaceae bacterium]